MPEAATHEPAARLEASGTLGDRLVPRRPSPGVLTEGAQGHSPHRGAPASRGRCGPLSRERPSQPGGCFSPSPSRALSSRPHIRVWSAAAAVSAGPGRSQWRPREAERRPRAAPSPRNFRLPKPHNFSEGGAWAEGEAEAGSPRDAAEPRAAASFPHAELAAAHGRAPPLPAAPGHTSSPPRGEAVPRAVLRRPPRVAGPAPPGGACGAGRPPGRGEDGRLDAERRRAEILLGSLLLLRH